MASTVPASGLSLRGAGEQIENLKPGSSSAILFKLDDVLVRDLKKAAQSKDGLRFTTGGTPKLRIGGRTIDLTLSADSFRAELFASTTSSITDFTFTNIVSHRAVLRTTPTPSEVGTDTALAALQSSLESIKQDKEAKQAQISDALLPAPKNRFEAARREKKEKKGGFTGMNSTSQMASPSLSAVGTPRLGPAPTSVPANPNTLKMQAMRKAVIHLLAIKPAKREDLLRQTHLSKDDLDHILSKFGEQVDGKWQLTKTAYNQLDVWEFDYPSQEDRQAAIDNAVHAYDRSRLAQDHQLWQKLLPEHKRNKGVVLSKSKLGGGQMMGGSTPSYQPSPMPHLDGTSDSRAPSSVNTPRVGPTGARPGSSNGNITKRLLNPQKARAAEEEQERKRKRKEQDAATSDREGGKPAKRQATKKATTTKVKSAEFVHSSDEESEGEKEVKKPAPRKGKGGEEAVKSAAKPKSKAAVPAESDSDTPLKSRKPAESAGAQTKSNAAATKKATESAAVKTPKPATAGKATPQTKATNGLSAPSPQHQSQLSPRNPGTRPSVPSPLGAARPRVASDVSDRSAVGVQRVRHGAETPKGLGIVHEGRSRADTVTGRASATSSGEDKAKQPPAKQQTATTNGTSSTKPAMVNGGSKRVLEDSPFPKDDGPPTKHRKTESMTSQGKLPLPISATNGTAESSPHSQMDLFDGEQDASVLETITFTQGVGVAADYQRYYPAYNKLYSEIEALQARGEKVEPSKMDRFRKMHQRLKEMKEQMRAASKREPVDG